METEEVTLKFKSQITEEKRTVYVFFKPEDNEKELRYSAFPPNLPELIIGKFYKMKVVHVPVPNSPGKHYHNIYRESKDGEYYISEASGHEIQSTLDISSKPTQPANKDKYWEERNEQILWEWAYREGGTKSKEKPKIREWAEWYYKEVKDRVK